MYPLKFDHMLKKIFLIALVFAMSITWVQGQEKKPLDFSVYNGWKTIEDKGLSNNGNWVFFEAHPYEGDGNLYLWSEELPEKKVFPRGTGAVFAPTSEFVAFTIKPFHDTIRQMKLDEVPDKKLPKDSLGIYLFDDDLLIRHSRVKSFSVPDEGSNWMVYQLEKPLEDGKDDGAEESEEEKEEGEKGEGSGKQSKEKEKEGEGKNRRFDENAPETSEMVVYNPVENEEHRFEDVSEYAISENGETIAFVQLQNDTILSSTVQVFDTGDQKASVLFEATGLARKLVPDHRGEQLSFIHSPDTIKSKVYELYYWDGTAAAPERIVDTLTPSIPEKWTVGEHGKIYFSRNDERLFFGTDLRPEPEPEDTLLEEEKVKVDVWNWKDKLLQPQQLENLEREKKRTYLAVYHTGRDKVVQLADTKVREVEPVLEGDGDVAIGTNRQPYMRRMSWEMPPYEDIYLVNINTGERELIREEIQSHIDISSSGRYFFWYAYADSNWYAHNIETNTTRNLTGGLDVAFYNEDHDYPQEPNPYYYAGWTEGDEYFLVYDRYDIWKLDPDGEEEPQNLTGGFGRENHMRLRYVELDEDARFIDPDEDLLLKAEDEDTKATGFYTVDLKGRDLPEKKVMEDAYFYTPEKAENAGRIIWRKSTFEKYPDVWYSNADFSNARKISETNPQQDQYIWGDVELVHWTAPNGREAEGLLYKPENFDPDKEYPMLVYFYRLSSDGLHRHYVPKPSRSVINRTFYVSNGYLVFVPNIRYDIGYPGESAHEYVTSGTLSLINSKDYIDKERVGIQGQSWGGYQVAHIITMTDMYAAASPGAPVSNMTSAYGGIRWGSGMSRMFQYEETQSRIGGSLWEKPLQYIQNSPVFYAPRVNTPLLMRHNDGDGAVPWYQGIEYFVALRRLNKPVWMLNYNDAPHNERAKSPNCRDLSIRMKQFFDHYLKDQPAPVWMEKGIPAIKKGDTKGYELVE